MIEIPNTSQRQLVLGKTGSGKTRAAVWNLSLRNLNYMPWVVLNHKGEGLIDSVPGAIHADLGDTPKKPGLYVYHPIPEVDDERVTSLLWRLHGRENVGLYIDEGYMVDRRDPAMQAILTQGRSKHIPMIVLSQRPVWLSRFAVSESDFFQVFKLTDRRDRDLMRGFLPVDLEYYMASRANEEEKLPQYHSIWYDVGRNKLAIMQPVPGDADILSRLEDQLVGARKGERRIVLI